MNTKVKDEAARRLSTGVIDLIRVIEQLRRESAARQGFSDLEFRVLIRIATLGTASPEEVARERGLSGADVQAEIDDLVDSGYVVRTKDGAYAATPAGEKIARAAVDGLTSTVAAALGPASDDEAQQLVLLVDLTTRMLSQSLEGSGS